MLRLPIVASPMRGCWWLPTSRGKVLRVLGGTYEPEQTSSFVRWVKAGSTVIDIGAHVGYYTLLASILAGDNGSVWAFEPEPVNAAFLRRHVGLNRRTNVHVEEAAVSDAVGNCRFSRGTGSGTGHLDAKGDMRVRTVRLTDFCSAHDITPSAIKIDVEGSEMAVLQGAREVIVASRPLIFLSTHGTSYHRRCLEWLRSTGYSLQPIVGTNLDTASEILGLPDHMIA